MEKVKTISDLDTQEFLLLYRHWKWADMVKDQHLKSDMKFGSTLFFEPRYGLMFVWYGLLFVLIEFIKEKQLSISTIAKEIEGVEEQLRLCRNAVFHIQPTLGSEKLGMMWVHPKQDDILKIHSEIGGHVQKEFKKRIAEVPPKVKMMFNISEAMPEEYLIHQLFSLQGYHI